VGLSDESLDKLIIVKANNRFLPGFDNMPSFDNALTNTNLFSLDEQKLIEEARSKIGGENYGAYNYRNTYGDGYDLFYKRDSTGNIDEFKVSQIRRGLIDGLVVRIGNGHCYDWKRYSKGMAVDKWLLWDKDGNLFRYVVFKEPFDFQRYTHWRLKIQITMPWPWNDELLLTTTWP
jgi:hypothetical protein